MHIYIHAYYMAMHVDVRVCLLIMFAWILSVHACIRANSM